MTILEDARATEVDALVTGDKVLVDPVGFAEATGWKLAPEGLCRGEVCVPLARQPGAVVGERIDVERVAPLLGRSVVADGSAGVVALGELAGNVAQRLRDLVAADFTLPTLDGEPFTFSTLGRRKKLLVAWASW